MARRAVLRPADIAEAAVLVAAVEEGSLGRAGRRLGVSQPAITKRVRALEALAGTPLLERDSRGVRPTQAGLRLYEAAVRLLAESERFGDALAGLREEPVPLRLAVIYSLSERAVARWLAAHRASAGEIAVEVRVGHPQQVRRWVASGQSDLGFAAGPIDDDGRLVERPFAEDELVAVVPRGHPWATAGEVAAAELAATPVAVREPGSGTRALLDAALAAAGLPPVRAALVLASSAGIRHAVAEQGVPGVLSRLALGADAPDGLVAVRVADLDLRRPLTVLWRRGAAFTDDQRDLLNAAEVDGRRASAAVSTEERRGPAAS